MSFLRAVLLLFAAATAPACVPASPPTPAVLDVAASLAGVLPETPRPRPSLVFVQSWDGAPHHVVSELERRGLLPNLSRLRRSGVWAKDGVLPAYPSQTAPGHARLWTGAPERVNGITGNTLLSLPKSEHTVLEGTKGFSGAQLLVEPVWITAARQGKAALVWNAPQSVPYPASLQSDRASVDLLEKSLRVVHGYDDPEILPALLDVTALGTGSRELTVGSVRVRVWQPGPVAAPPIAAVATDAGPSRRTADGAGFRLDIVDGNDVPRHLSLNEASGFSRGVPVAGSTPVYFRLIRGKDDTLQLLHSGVSALHGNGTDLFSRVVDAGGGMIANGPHALYLQGSFGKTLAGGGSGEAEETYLDAIAYLIELNRRSMTMLLQGRPWDLVVNYLPVPDEALHMWYGFVDKDFASKNPVLARRVRRLIERLFVLLDSHLGAVLASLGPEDSFFLVSDHGMEGCDRDLVLNEALRRAGYLKTDAAGRVDLSQTRAYYGPGNSAWILLNDTEFKDGIVHPEEMPALSEEIGRMVMKLQDPVDGTPLVRGVFLPHATTRDYGGPLAGPIYVDPAPGVYLRSGFADGELVVRFPPAGRHMFHPSRPEMKAILYAFGPGLGARELAGPISQLVLAPTVCRLLQIEPAPSMGMAPLLEMATSR